MRISSKVALAYAQPVPGLAPTSDDLAPPASSWSTPRLTAYGDVRQLTMGVSPGINDSNNPGTLQA
jgi:hypothetical protein